MVTAAFADAGAPLISPMAELTLSVRGFRRSVREFPSPLRDFPSYEGHSCSRWLFADACRQLALARNDFCVRERELTSSACGRAAGHANHASHRISFAAPLSMTTPESSNSAGPRAGSTSRRRARGLPPLRSVGRSLRSVDGSARSAHLPVTATHPVTWLDPSSPRGRCNAL